MLKAEITELFGTRITAMSRRLKPGQVDALAVKEAAGALLLLKGRPVDQAALVKSMKLNTAAALCRWLTDPNFWRQVGRISMQ